MKKLAALLLALALALSGVAAIAETYDQPILFRGLPWGISFAELKNQIAFWGGLKQTYWNITFGLLIENSQDDPYAHIYTAMADYDNSEKEAIGDVAGYKVLNIKLYFVRLSDENGALTEDDVHTALYGARYELSDPVDPNVKRSKDEKMADLTAKLSSVYGEPDTSLGYPIWRGAEGTALALKSSSEIVYASEAGDALMQQATAEATAASEAEFVGNTNGL